MNDGHPALVVVDGVVRRVSTNLDLENIVSVEVLKGPAAIERFGADAQYGVILVVTDRSKPKRT